MAEFTKVTAAGIASSLAAPVRLPYEGISGNGEMRVLAWQVQRDPALTTLTIRFCGRLSDDAPWTELTTHAFGAGVHQYMGTFASPWPQVGYIVTSVAGTGNIDAWVGVLGR